MREASSVRRWCFTLNNYTEEEFEQIKRTSSDRCSYAIIGQETGESGTPHLQAYVCLKRRLRFTSFKNTFNRRIHLEPARSSPATNKEYCSKSGVYWEFGTMPKYGRSSDKKSISRDEAGEAFIKTMEANTGVREFMLAHPGTWLWHGDKLMKNYTLGFQKPLAPRPGVKAYWLHGPPGVGKSWVAHTLFPDAYIKDSSSKWWDGYMGEDTVIIDDLSPDFCDFNLLLRWMDQYKCRVEFKGGFIPLSATRFILTSNVSPLGLIPQGVNYGAIARRVRTYHVETREACELAMKDIESEAIPSTSEIVAT